MCLLACMASSAHKHKADTLPQAPNHKQDTLPQAPNKVHVQQNSSLSRIPSPTPLPELCAAAASLSMRQPLCRPGTCHSPHCCCPRTLRHLLQGALRLLLAPAAAHRQHQQPVKTAAHQQSPAHASADSQSTVAAISDTHGSQTPKHCAHGQATAGHWMVLAARGWQRARCTASMCILVARCAKLRALVQSQTQLQTDVED